MTFCETPGKEEIIKKRRFVYRTAGSFLIEVVFEGIFSQTVPMMGRKDYVMIILMTLQCFWTLKLVLTEQ